MPVNRPLAYRFSGEARTVFSTIHVSSDFVQVSLFHKLFHRFVFTRRQSHKVLAVIVTEMALLAVLLIVLLLQFYTTSPNPHSAVTGVYSMEQFLKPLRNLQIIVRLESKQHLATEREALAVPLQKTLDYLKENDVPIQIFSTNDRTPTLGSALRYARNRFSWVSFIVVARTEPLSMMDILNSCRL